MAGWSDLSTALKRNVIGRMDLMSRYSFRCSDRQNRSIVDTTDHFIPRARLSIKKSGYLIMIHSGIDDWLRVEIRKDADGKTVVKKSQNSWNPEDAVETESPFSMRRNAIQIMLGLLGHKAILIDAMEFEVEGGTDTEKQDEEKSMKKCTIKMIKLVSAFREFVERNHLFRVRKIVTDWNSYPQLEMVIREMCVPTEIKFYERLSLAVSPDSLVPVCCGDTSHAIKVLGKPQCTSSLVHSKNGMNGLDVKLGLVVLASVTDGFATLRFANMSEYAKEMWINVNDGIEKVSPKLFRKEEFIPTDAGLMTLTHLRTACGYWVHAVVKKNESHLKSHLDSFYAEHKKTGVCGLSWLCKRCSNAFDYDYYQNLGRRVFLEPEWADVQCHGTVADGTLAREKSVVKAAREKYSEDHVKNQKTSRKNQKKMKKAWGFGKDSEDDVKEDSEDENQNYLVWEKQDVAGEA